MLKSRFAQSRTFEDSFSRARNLAQTAAECRVISFFSVMTFADDFQENTYYILKFNYIIHVKLNLYDVAWLSQWLSEYSACVGFVKGLTFPDLTAAFSSRFFKFKTAAKPRINDRDSCACPSLWSPYRAMDQLIIRLTMTESGGEFSLKIYSVNNSLRLVIYDFRISHAGWIRVRRRIQHPEKRLAAVERQAAAGRPWKWGNFSGANSVR